MAKSKRKRIEIEKTLVDKPFLPDTLDPSTFTVSRALEIESLLDAMKQSRMATSKRVFQRLPKHLRRRAASHAPKRVPRRHRQASLLEVEIIWFTTRHQHHPQHVNGAKDKHIIAEKDQQETQILKKKKLSRRSLRKNKKVLIQSRTACPRPDFFNLQVDTLMPSDSSTELASLSMPLSEKPFWLQTHYWHVKRFQMTSLWNYKIPLQTNSKIYRNSIRAMLKGCTLYDLSYEECFVVQSDEMDICSILRNVKEYIWTKVSPDLFCVFHPLSCQDGQNENFNSQLTTKDQSSSIIKAENLPNISAADNYFMNLNGKKESFECLKDSSVKADHKLLGIVGVEFIPVNGSFYHIFWIHPSISDSIWKYLKNIAKNFRGSFSRFELSGPKNIAILSQLFNLTIPSISCSIKIYNDSNKNPELLPGPYALLEDNTKDDYFVIRLRMRYDLPGSSFPSLQSPSPTSCSSIYNPDGGAIHSLENNSKILRVELIVPSSKAVEMWRRLVYTNMTLPIGIAERRTIHEQCSFLKPSIENLDAFFPFYIPGTRIFTEMIKEDYYTNIVQKDIKRPPSKRKILIPPSELLTKFLSPESWLGDFVDVGIAPLTMLCRGRLFYGSTIYFIDSSESLNRISDENVNTWDKYYTTEKYSPLTIPLPMEFEHQSICNTFSIKQELSIPTQESITSSIMICNSNNDISILGDSVGSTGTSGTTNSFHGNQNNNLSKYQVIRNSPDLKKQVLGFSMVNPIAGRHIACNGYSIVTGSGYALCVYDLNILYRNMIQFDPKVSIDSNVRIVIKTPTELKTIVCWVGNPNSPDVLYPAQLHIPI